MTNIFAQAHAELVDIIPPEVAAEMAQLRAERQFWRETACCKLLSHARSVVVQPGQPAPSRTRRKVLTAEMREMAESLRMALAGEFYCATCEGCSQPIKPGQPCIPCVDTDLHADCGDMDRYKPGDRIAVAAESVDVAEGETYDGFVTVFAATTLWDDEGIAGILQKALAVLATLDQRKAA